jgi:hypothetical protein
MQEVVGSTPILSTFYFALKVPQGAFFVYESSAVVGRLTNNYP